MTFSAIVSQIQSEKNILQITKPDKLKVVPSGSWVFDNLTGGVGGFPRGVLSELHGIESCGKTTLALCAAVIAQTNHKMPVLYLDNEHALNAAYAHHLGLNISDPSKCIIYKPVTLEENLEIVEAYFADALKNKYGIFVIVDSISTMIPKEIYSDPAKSITNWGLTSKLQTAFVQKFVKLISLTDSVGLMISQMRANTVQGPMAAFAEKEKATGGYAYRHLLSTRFLLKPGKKEKVKAEDKIAGAVERENVMQVIVKNKKNKVGMPYLTGTMYIRLGHGIDNIRTAVEAAIAHGHIVRGKTGAITCDKIPELKSRSITSTVALLETDKKLSDALLNLLGWRDKNGNINLTDDMTVIKQGAVIPTDDEEDDDDDDD